MANRRIALLIATDSYADPEFTDLRTPCTDASALATLLGDPAIGAFEVTTLLNRPAQDVRDLLEDTFAEASRDDLVLLHLSGHGLKDEAGKLQLILSDTRRNRLRSSAVAASWVRELIDHSAARRVVVWLDCCFSGAFPPGFTPKGTETVDAIDQLAGDSGRGCAVMTASTKVQYAFEKEQSVFTEAIMSGLRTGEADLNEDGLVDASELYSYVYDWVRTRSPGQTPTRNDMLSGDFHIAYNRNVLQLPLELAPELRQLLRSSDLEFRTMGVRKLTDMTARGVEAARVALAALGEEPQQPPAVVPQPPVVVDVPQPLTARLQQTASPGFRFLRGFRLNKRISCALIDPAEPHRLCVVSPDRGVQWFDAQDGRPVRGFFRDVGTGYGKATTVALSPDGSLLARAAFADIALFDRTTQQPVASYEGQAHGLAFTHDSQVLAGTDHERVTVWLVDDYQRPRFLQTEATCLAFSPKGTLATGHDGVVTLWDTMSSGSQLPHHGDVSAIAFTPDSRLLVTGDVHGQISIGTLDGTWYPIWLRRHQVGVVSVSFGPDGVMATASADGHVMFWKPD